MSLNWHSSKRYHLPRRASLEGLGLRDLSLQSVIAIRIVSSGLTPDGLIISLAAVSRIWPCVRRKGRSFRHRTYVWPRERL